MPNNTRACDERADLIFEKLGDLAEEVKDGTLDPQAARVAADIEKWRLGRMKPKKYGDRSQVDHTSSDGSMSPPLSKKAYGMTKRRAVMIALDQTNKATDAISEKRAQEIGINYGFWQHRSGGKVPRPTHKGEMNGKQSPIAVGLYDPDPDL